MSGELGCFSSLTCEGIIEAPECKWLGKFMCQDVVAFNESIADDVGTGTSIYQGFDWVASNLHLNYKWFGKLG